MKEILKAALRNLYKIRYNRNRISNQNLKGSDYI